MTGQWPTGIDELLAVYALDAVDEDERAQVDRYLLYNPRAAAEVASYREALTHLQPGTTAPPALWDRIVQELETTPPPLRLDALGRPPASRRRPRRAIFAATAIALTTATGVFLNRQQRQRDLDPVAAAIQREIAIAHRNPRSRRLLLRGDDGALLVAAYLQPDGGLLLSNNHLPALQHDRTYQLWCLHNVEVSLAILGPTPTATKLHLDSCEGELAITNEHAGGAAQTSSKPVASSKSF